MTPEALRSAEHFISRNARLIDRHRFAYHFRSGPPAPIRSVLDSYRNVDGGFGNGLEPDLRGHGSQPLAVVVALRYLDELGHVPDDVAEGVCRYLTSIARDSAGVPPVLPTVRHTEAAPQWRERSDFGGALDPTATLVGLMHRHRICHAWRDRATAFCWSRIAALHWTDPDEAIAVCTFLQHVPDRRRAHAEFERLRPAIRAVIETDPDAGGHVHKPLDLASHPDHIARRLFTDEEISAHLDALCRRRLDDGGWDITWDSWAVSAHNEWRGILTVRHLKTLRDYGRLSADVPAPLRIG
ncbi:prenyltransferase [Streptomonospora sp. PA3]|uniref:prenyltransferase n=1 Tax=Streptomonospora sp. PA3 TaxID=2607326 RepID=UPI00130CE9FE|nr:prenyltransferase [Streptomonospora sp. PA3]